MAWTTPSTVVAGQTLSAAFWNEQVRDNLDAIRDAQINIQSTTKVDTFSTTSASPVDITGLSVTITPSSATSKVLIIFSGSVAGNTGDVKGFVLVRDSTNIGGGTAAGSRLSNITVATTSASSREQASGVFLDSPATTSATTYKLQTYADVVGRLTYIGRSVADTDTAQPAQARTSFTITAIEVPV